MTYEHIAIVILSAACLFLGFTTWFNDRERKDYRERWLKDQPAKKPIINYSELAESIADWCGVYGVPEGDVDHEEGCKCRICFTMAIAERIKQEIEGE